MGEKKMIMHVLTVCPVSSNSSGLKNSWTQLASFQLVIQPSVKSQEGHKPLPGYEQYNGKAATSWLRTLPPPLPDWWIVQQRIIFSRRIKRCYIFLGLGFKKRWKDYMLITWSNFLANTWQIKQLAVLQQKHTKTTAPRFTKTASICCLSSSVRTARERSLR